MRIRSAKFSPIPLGSAVSTHYATGRPGRREGWRAGAAKLRGRAAESEGGVSE